jgi:hypothetical protein
MAKDRAKTSYFSTRITQRTRNLLEDEANRAGESLAVMAEHLLQMGLEQRAGRRSRKEKSLNALFYLIEELTKIVAGRHANDPKYNWRTNPYMLRAFRAAVTHLLASLPPGKLVRPAPRQSPEKRGRDAARVLLSYMHLADLRAEMVADGILTSLHDALNADLTNRKFSRASVDARYALSDAFRRLGIVNKKLGRVSVDAHYALSDAFRHLGLNSKITRNDDAFLRGLQRQLEELVESFK